MKYFRFICVCNLVVLFLSSYFASAQENALVLPSKAQIAWQNAEFGVVFHYDLHVFDGKAYSQDANRIDPLVDYQIFNPKQLNTDQWIETVKAAGAKFAILTVTHETGFALYPSNVYPYNVKLLKWKDGKGDILRDFVNSCKKYDIKPGIYVGIRWNGLLGVHDFKVSDQNKELREKRQKHYNTMIENMLKELCTNYGDFFEIWFDGGASDPKLGAPDVLPIVSNYQPDALFYWNAQRCDARWAGSESGKVGYPNWSTFTFKNTFIADYPGIYDDNAYLMKHGDVDGKFWMPAMSDAPLRGYNGRHEWFWEPNDEKHIEPLENLLDMYYQSVGRNSTLILGLTPDTAGLLPAPDVHRLREFGAAINKRFENKIVQTHFEGTQKSIKFRKTASINQMVLQEDISRGERVLAYQLWAKPKSKWIKVAEGTSVGNKRIQTFDAVMAKDWKIVFTKYKAQPIVKNLELYQAEQVKIYD